MVESIAAGARRQASQSVGMRWCLQRAIISYLLSRKERAWNELAVKEKIILTKLSLSELAHRT